MKVSIIIPVYKRIDFLELVIQGIARQSYTDFEVIIAEDDNSLEVAHYIEKQKQRFLFSITHLQQEDLGFRKNRILNHAISIAQGELIAFIDGDCVPHRHLLKAYVNNYRPNRILFGRRVLLGERYTLQLLQEKSIRNLNFLKLLFSDSKRIEDGIYLPFNRYKKKPGRGLLGCNWAISKTMLTQVNGFDEDYTKAGVGEDNDIQWRLEMAECMMYPMKYKSIVYHLFHKANYAQQDVRDNMLLMKDKITKSRFFCTNGILKNC